MYSCLQVRSDNEEAKKHVLKDACEQVHLEYSITHLETHASNGRGENRVRAMKEMIQCQKDAVCTLGIGVVGATECVGTESFGAQGFSG